MTAAGMSLPPAEGWRRASARRFPVSPLSGATGTERWEPRGSFRRPRHLGRRSLDRNRRPCPPGGNRRRKVLPPPAETRDHRNPRWLRRGSSSRGGLPPRESPNEPTTSGTAATPAALRFRLRRPCSGARTRSERPFPGFSPAGLPGPLVENRFLGHTRIPCRPKCAADDGDVVLPPVEGWPSG